VPLSFFLEPGASAGTKPPRPGTDDYRLPAAPQEATGSSSSRAAGRSKGHHRPSTISKGTPLSPPCTSRSSTSALHLDLPRAFKDTQKPVAYAFPTEKEYLAFSPHSKGTQGRFMVRLESGALKKDLAWFSTPPGEKDFYKTDYGVVQHEATHQLLDAYTNNQSIPVWFHEGCATFFESWNLDESNSKNILSGASEHLRPRRLPHSPGEARTSACRVLDRSPEAPLPRAPGAPRPGDKQAPGAAGRDLRFKAGSVIPAAYNEAWCAMTFFIDHDVGREVFALSSTHSAMAEAPLGHPVEVLHGRIPLLVPAEWYKFIEKKVTQEVGAVDGGERSFASGTGASPPAKTVGFALTDDRRGDLFEVRRKRGCPKAFSGEKWWMLKAWGRVPVRFYQEAWKEAPGLGVTNSQIPIIASAYRPRRVRRAAGVRTRFFFLLPAWAPISPSDESLAKRMEQAAAGLIEEVVAPPSSQP
jgi:hypothetical protein